MVTTVKARYRKQPMKDVGIVRKNFATNGFSLEKEIVAGPMAIHQKIVAIPDGL